LNKKTDKKINKLEIMLNMQESLNILTSGKNWKNKITNKGKKISWDRCIYMELCELIDSTSWKHWKNINESIDIDNILIELVDIWHFMLSKLLENNKKKDILKIIQNEYDDDINYKTTSKNEIKQEFILQSSERFLKVLILDDNTKTSYINILKEFFTLCANCSLSYEWLYKLYIGKNALNKFRQDNGYKEGLYKKIWNINNLELEDNVVMQGILNNNVNCELTLKYVYDKLKEIYKTL
jgi:dimeric dUTPase (all-alpha-NTP-PPase superfamily)